MEPAADEASFVRAPVGRWRVAGRSLIWAYSPTLCGSICWGRQNAEETRAVMRLFDGFPQLAPEWDLILDGSAMEKVEASSLLVFGDWIRKNFDQLRQRVRRHVGVVPPGLGGYLLAGLFPMLGGPWPVRLVREPRDAFRFVLPDGGDALCEELTRLVEQSRGVSPVLAELRRLLVVERGRLSVGQAAAALQLSPRSLQRSLREFGRSYRQEQQEARYLAAEELLASDDKIAAVAAQIGLSEASLTALVKHRAGITPGELRRRLRAGEETG